MDVQRVSSTSFYTDVPVEGYSSMVWTERYLEPGEFELKTNEIEYTLDLLPEMTLLTHRETDEVMFVETHSIARDENGLHELTVTGRTLDAFTNFRYVIGPWAREKYMMARNYTTAEAACVLLWNCLVNPSENDVTRLGPGGRSTLDNIPNVVISNSVINADTGRYRRWLTGGQAYQQIIDLLTPNKQGVRIIRPDSGPFKQVKVTTDDKGIITTTDVTETKSLRFDVYDGVDHTRGKSDNEVIFHFDSGHIDTPSYLYSVADYDNVAYIVSSVGVARAYRGGTGEGTLSGLQRRALWVDGGTPEEKESKSDFLDDLPNQGLLALAQHERVKMMDGQISSMSPYKYGIDYGLGDKVTMMGEYGFDQDMTVSEYIRTEDAAGDRGYPGLASLTSDDNT